MQHRLSQFVAIVALVLAANAGAATPSNGPDESKCLVQLWVRFTGQVQVAQIIKSSGAPRLDDACIKAVLNQTMKPGSRDGIVTDTWATLPIVWKLRDSKGQSIPPTGPDEPVQPIPALARDQALNVDPPYDPRSTADQRLEAICGLHVRVSADAIVESVRVVHSCGSAALDQASMDALYAANFIAARQDETPVAAEGDVWLAWVPPRPSPAERK